MNVMKRSGAFVPFDFSKIERAVQKAFTAAKAGNVPNSLLMIIKEKVEEQKEGVSVETIQDIVVDSLLDFDKRIGKLYMTYRVKHAVARDMDDPINLIETYLSRKDNMLEKENSSMEYSLQGLHQALFSTPTEKYWLKIMPEEIMTAHKTGRVHLHDMGVLGAYCTGWDLRQLLNEGFTGVPTKTSSGPAKHFKTALGQIVNFMYTISGEVAGAIAFSNMNTLLAPFVRHDGLTSEQVKQAIQEFIFNMNISTRVGFQSPFTNLTLDIDVTKTGMANDYAVIGGTYINSQYKDYQEEAVMIAEAMVEVMEEGDANGSMFPYPIITFNVSKDFPWNSPLGEKICRATAKYGPFYFANYINSSLSESDVKSMCCRLKLSLKDMHDHMNSTYGEDFGVDQADLEVTHQKGGGFFGAGEMTGSIGVVTLGLPAIMADAIKVVDNSYKAEFMEYMTVDEIMTEYIDEFKISVREYMDMAMSALTLRRKVVEKLTDKGLYPYCKHYLRSIKQRTGKYWSQHFSTIGLNGMHEALLVAGIDGGITSMAGYEIAEELLEFMNKYTVELQKEYRTLVNLEQTPAESAGVKLCLKSGIDPESKGYYTNSTWFPAEFRMDLFDTVMAQSDLNRHYTGGSALHLYTEEDLRSNPMVIGTLTEKIFELCDIPYIDFAPIYSTCINPSCEEDYLVGIVNHCPVCGGEVNNWARIVGYYRPVTNWNEGRQAELKVRSGYNINESTPITIERVG